MLHKQLRDIWIERSRNEQIDPVPRFAKQGIVLGAGTVLLASDGDGRRLQQVKGQESRLLALLSAACGEVLPASVAGNVERAAKCWSEGDDCLAYIHLAHARLPAPRDARASAYRLLVAERAMSSGIAPRTILQAIQARHSDADLVDKFDPNEARVPVGSGRTSGEWTNSGIGGDAVAPTGTSGRGAQAPSLLGPPPAASFLGTISASQAAALLRFLRYFGAAGGAVGVFSLLLVPSPNEIHVEGEVSGVPGLRYSWNRDETLLRLVYDDPDGGRRTFSAQLDGDLFRDPKGRIVGRVLSGSKVVIDAAAISSDLVDEDEPRLCPDLTKDRRTNDKGLDYENYIKSIVNPGNPTPPFMAYQLSNAIKAVTFDDCEHSTGTMVEIKDGYEGFLKDDWGRAFLTAYFRKQAMDQTSAAGARPVRWYFSQEPVADFARQVFERFGLENIKVVFKARPGTSQ